MRLNWILRVVAVNLTLVVIYHVYDYSNAVSNSAVYKIEKQKVPETKVLLMTYKRSGSTFLGELFQQNAVAWYYFEPLAFFSSRVLPSHRFSWSNAVQPYSELREAYRQRIRYLDDILSCRFDHPILLQYYSEALHKKSSTKRFFHPQLFVHFSRRLNQALSRPERPLRDWCLQYPLRVAKTIRLLHLEAVYEFLPNDTKVVHLVRDPRAIFVSRRSRTASPDNICKPLAENLRLSSEKPDSRLIVVKYEHMAQSPHQTAVDLYGKLGMRLPETVAQWIDASTKTDKRNRKKPAMSDQTRRKNGVVSLTLKRNSTAAASHWISDIDPADAARFDADENCRLVYRLMGYMPYEQLVHA